MRLYYISLLLIPTVVGGCDLIEPDEPETTIYGFWDDVESSSDAYRWVTPTEVVSFNSRYGDDCFDRTARPATSATDTRVEVTDPETGRLQTVELDSSDTDRMTLTVGSFVGNVRFAHERADGEDPSIREVERLVCED